MDRVIIGMDPHKASVTIEARDTRDILRAKGRFATDNRQYKAMLQVSRQWPERLWAVEGANGIGSRWLSGSLLMATGCWTLRQS